MDNMENFSAPAGENNPEAPVRPQASLSDISPNLSLLPATPPKPKRQGWLIGLICLLVGILAAAGVGAATYYGYLELPINIPFIQPDPQEIVRKMYLKMSELKAVGYEAEMKMDLRIEDSAGADAPSREVSEFGLTTRAPINSINSGTISFEGESDWLNKEDVKFISKLKTSFISSNASALLGLSDEVKFGLEAKGDKKINYLRVTEMPDVPFVDVSKVINKWIKIDYSTGTMAQLADLQNKIEDAQKKSALTLDQEKQIKALFGKYDVLKVVKKFPEEKINNQKTYHYGFSLDKAELKKAVEEANKITNGEIVPENTMADFNEGVEALNMLDGEMWIGKNDSNLYRLSIASSSYGGETGKKMFIGLSLVLNFNKFNEPVIIEAPADSMSIEELIKSIFGNASFLAKDDSVLDSDNVGASSTEISLLGDVGEAVQAEITSSTPILEESDLDNDSDGDGLTDYQETNIYHTDLNSPDTDGDGYKDGDEVKNGYNPNGPGKLSRPIQ